MDAMTALSRSTAVIAVAALGTLITATALGHGGDTTKIHGCVVKDTKYVRIVGASDNCKSNETALDWSVQGPPGVPGASGPVGPAGEQGEQGPAGPGGVSGWEIVQEDHLLQPNTERGVVVECPAGKKVLGGGWDAPFEIFDNEHLSVGRTGPLADGSGWWFAVDNDAQNEPGLLVWFRAVCASVS